jgi:Mitochondrial carrier protein
MQVVGMSSRALGYQYSGALDAARVIIRTEGVRGMYRGLWPNLRALNLSFHFRIFSVDRHSSQGGTEHRNVIFHVRVG